MPLSKSQAKEGKEKLQRIIDLCRSLQKRSLDPFLLDVDKTIDVTREYFPQWEKPDELCLDAEVIHQLASVVKLQGDWVKHRSTSLYKDPFLLEDKLRQMDKESIVEVFLGAWRPIAALEQISIRSLRGALDYWENLQPMNERWKELNLKETELGLTTREELARERMIRDREFSEELEEFWQQLKRMVKKEGKERIQYWDFIAGETYHDAAQRAFMTSFLVTYGYATLEIYPLEEELFIRPLERPSKEIGDDPMVSIPIAVTESIRSKWLRGERD